MASIRGIASNVLRDVGVSTVKGGAFSWDSYWTSRINNTPESEILNPYLWRDSEDEYCYVNDTGALDVGNTYDFTLACWVNITLSSSNTWEAICGKQVTGANVSGEYGFYVNKTTHVFVASVYTSGGAKEIISTVNARTAGWCFLRMDIRQSDKRLRFFINETQIGADETYSGTFGSLAADYLFLVGAWQNTSKVVVAPTWTSQDSDIYIARRILSESDITSIYTNRSNLTSALAHWPLEGNCPYDVSGNGYHLTTGNITDENIGWGVSGSRHSRKLGYSIYSKSGSLDKFVPYLDSGVPLTSPTLPVGYAKLGDYSPSNVFGNYKILITDDGYDKSDMDVFEIDSKNSRYYDLSYPTGWHVRYELLNKKRDFYITPTRPFSISYYWTDSNYLATRDDKILKYNDTNTLSLSLDGGDTFAITKTFTEGGRIQFAHIFSNGNILWATDQKMFLSDDNLSTYAETTVLDVAGDTYTPSTYDNFFRLTVGNYVEIGGVEYLVWGTYSNAVGTITANINIWYSIDSGVTIKSCYKFAVSTPTLAAAHIHSIDYQASDNSWWCCTGDTTTSVNWMKGTYNSGTDAWTWESVKIGAAGTWWKSTQMRFIGDNLIWACDNTENLGYSRKGLWKTPYASPIDVSKYERIYTPELKESIAIGGKNNILLYSKNGKELAISIDGGLSVYPFEIAGGPTLHATTPYMYACYPANTDGYYKISIVADGESINDNKGPGLMLKIV